MLALFIGGYRSGRESVFACGAIPLCQWREWWYLTSLLGRI